MDFLLRNSLYIGPALGFSVFLLNVATLEGVFIRPDANNNNVFTLEGLWGFMLAPFMIGHADCNTVWGILPGTTTWTKIKMLGLNWVLLTGLGSGFGYLTWKLATQS